ncbi:MAG: PQQ-dependent sugar dehydrogenase [Nocardioidaceae bacterium]
MARRHLLAVLCAAVVTVAPSVLSAPMASPAERIQAAPAQEALPAAAALVPLGFSDRVIADVPQPTGMAFTPDGRMLVISKPGRLYVVEQGQPNQLALDISNRICSEKELGLVGIAVDPNFATNNSIYLYYTRQNGGTCTATGGTRLSNWVGRFELRNDNIVPVNSEVEIVGNIDTTEAHHIAGDLEFGENGFLYISVGDGVCTTVGPRKCAGLNDAPQKRNVPHGKILRVDRNGIAPADNPYANAAGSRRCTNPSGIPGGTGPCREIFAIGFRNPFRFARKPGTDLFYVNDVGRHTWEEVNRLAMGKNYGWNVREGSCARDSTTNCGSVAPYRNPIYDYPHSSTCTSVTGGAFVPDGLWPGYNDVYMFADYTCGRIFELRQNASGQFTRSTFIDGLPGPVHLRFGPHDGSQALYYLDIAQGAVHRVTLAADNEAPIADFTYTPDGRALAFDGSASSDPNSGDSVVGYQWDFGDGTTTGVRTSPQVNHTYATDGPFQVTLTVTDNRGLVSEPLPQTVHSGEHPPTIQITAPDPAARFAVNEQLTLRATATDPEDGTLQGASIDWVVQREHGTHFHPWTSGTGAMLPVDYPSPEDLGAADNSWLLATATATDSKGIQASVDQQLLPDKVNLTFETRPTGGDVVVEGTREVTRVVITSWVGHNIPVGAPDQRINGTRYVFDRWSDGRARNHTIESPATATTYIAHFRR